MDQLDGEPGAATPAASVPMADPLPAGVTFVSLQKGAAPAELAGSAMGTAMVDWTDELTDFGETGALVQTLDLVIGVDTAVVHLAGAMGKPVWVLLPRVPDFRWLLDRAASPWYPSARLFRKGQADTWDAVIAGVADELAACAAPAMGRARSA